MNGCSFQQNLRQKLGWLLSQHWKALFLRGLILKPTEGAQILLENSTKDFQISPPFERSACFYMTINRNSERFQYFNFEADFWNTKIFSKKLENRFLVESNKVENASSTYKTAISKANGKTNRRVSTKWTYHKNIVLLVITSYF